MDVVYKTEKATFNYRVAGIWVKDGHVLLHRAVSDESWSLPGGRVAIGEESALSIQREFIEELDVSVEIERLVWFVENFFQYNGIDIHEVGLYYLVKTEDESMELNKEPFFGKEGERLIYKWTPVHDLEAITLYPEFLRKALQEIPGHPAHLVVKQKEV
ncbi:NUDIX domain-containing protein [Bacillus salacetis]|uniref:NUDIX domain-containing protein n=1 Tax=Bacillus salacetis TaxID=2315464 RepID=A0A3A1QYL9_9BACI|nr:NUDIX hydrolase [Bacillus salacetis]RIW31968.1 NUDIX domain-containing protein [Bacillus salacetis]